MLDSLSSLKSQKSSISRRISDFNNHIGKEANKLLKEIPDADEDFYFRKIDEDVIVYEKSTYGGRDWNNQDIYDIDEFHLPVDLLYDEDFKSAYIKKIEDDKLTMEIKKKERELERQKEKEFEERKRYLELKAKYEGSGDEK